MEIFGGEEQLMSALMPEYGLTDLHFGFGLEILNALGLHEPGNKLLTDCRVVNPDNASGILN